MGASIEVGASIEAYYWPDGDVGVPATFLMQNADRSLHIMYENGEKCSVPVEHTRSLSEAVPGTPAGDDWPSDTQEDGDQLFHQIRKLKERNKATATEAAAAVAALAE